MPFWGVLGSREQGGGGGGAEEKHFRELGEKCHFSFREQGAKTPLVASTVEEDTGVPTV